MPERWHGLETLHLYPEGWGPQDGREAGRGHLQSTLEEGRPHVTTGAPGPPAPGSAPSWGLSRRPQCRPGAPGWPATLLC